MLSRAIFTAVQAKDMLERQICIALGTDHDICRSTFSEKESTVGSLATNENIFYLIVAVCNNRTHVYEKISSLKRLMVLHKTRTLFHFSI